MKLSISIPLALAILAAPAMTQSSAKLKKDLGTKERAAKNDPDALFEVAKWAKENSLEADAKRLFEKVLKLAPNHVGANEALGNELLEGKWVPAAEAEKARQQAKDAEFLAKGLVKVSTVWVAPDEVDDAKRGVFHHDGEAVTERELQAFQSGMRRHPETGQLIGAEHLEQAKNGYFPIGEKRWVDLKEADNYHGDADHPWVVRSSYATIISTLPLAKIMELKIYADQGQEKVAPLFGGHLPPPAKRPAIIIAKTEAEYRRYGTELGDGTDVAGAFLMRPESNVRLAYQGEVRAAICDNHPDWGTRYVRHAAALAYVNALAEEAGADLPLWFLHGMGSLTSRFENDSDAGWFGKQHLAKGGVSNLQTFFTDFRLNGDMESKEIAAEVFQAGLVLSYASRSDDAEMTEAMKRVTDALSGKGGSATTAIDKLQELLANSQEKVAAHLKELVAKAP